MICKHKNCPLAKHQSNPMHNMFFGRLRASYHHWPESYTEFQPSSEKHLRAWFICQRAAKWRNEIIISTDLAISDEGIAFMQKVLLASGTYSWIFRLSHGAVVVSPKSMDFDSMPHRDRKRLIDVQESTICDVFGLSNIDQLKKAYEDAA